METKKVNYPCRTCIVRACCGQDCEDIVKDIGQLAVRILSTNKCPDCGVDLSVPTEVTNMFVCTSCPRVFVNYNSDHEPRPDAHHIQLTDPNDRDNKLRMERLTRLHSAEIVSSVEQIIKERLEDPTAPQKRKLEPSELQHTQMTVQKFKLTPKTKIWGQKQLNVNNVNHGDIITKVGGKWVSKYEQECELGSIAFVGISV